MPFSFFTRAEQRRWPELAISVGKGGAGGELLAAEVDHGAVRGLHARGLRVLAGVLPATHTVTNKQVTVSTWYNTKLQCHSEALLNIVTVQEFNMPVQELKKIDY